MPERIAVVTGGSEGIGHEVVKMLSRREDVDGVLSIARREVADAGKVRNLRFDLSNEGGVDAAVQGVREGIGNGVISVLVNNVGVLVGNTKCWRDPAALRRMRFTNAGGHARLTRGLLDRIARDGRVVEIGSLAMPDTLPFVGITDYMDTKAHSAIDEVRSMAGNRFRYVHPGFAGTEMGSRFIQDVIDGNEERFPLEWLTLPPTEPSVIARAVERVISSDVGFKTVGSPGIADIYMQLPYPVQMALMPWFIKMNGCDVLNGFGVTPEQHDEHVRRHKDMLTYGPDFPYNAVMSERLWHPAVGRFAMGAMSKVGLF